MNDILFVFIILAFFLVSWGLISAFQRFLR
jgi:hypothetical protein